MNINDFSKHYEVRTLTNDDIEIIYNLCKGNPLYYEYCPPTVTRESICEDIVALPPNIDIKHKYYVGFFDSEKMIAVMDLIDGYPEKDIAFIGFFMMDASVHDKGIGSAIISDVLEYLKDERYTAVRLAWVKGNPQAEHFWIKNGFTAIKETSSTAAEHVILAERKIL